MTTQLPANPYDQFKGQPYNPNRKIDFRPEMSEFGKGVRAFGDESQAIGGGLLALGAEHLKSVTPDSFGEEYLKPVAKWGLDTYKENMEEATWGRQKPKVSKYEDIGETGSLGDWASYNLGKGLPNLAALGGGSIVGRQVAKAGIKEYTKEISESLTKQQIAKAGAKKTSKYLAGRRVTEEVQKKAAEEVRKRLVRGEVAGGYLTGAGYEGGAAYGEAIGEGVDPERAKWMATGVGGLSGAMEFMPLYKVAKSLGAGDAAKKSMREIIKGDKKLRNMAVELAGRATKAGSLGAGVEGLTEGMQQLVNIAGMRWAKKDPMFADLTDEDWSQVKNSILTGGLVGGTAGGALGMARGPEGTEAEPKPDPTKTEEQAPGVEQPPTSEAPAPEKPGLDLSEGLPTIEEEEANQTEPTAEEPTTDPVTDPTDVEIGKNKLGQSIYQNEEGYQYLLDQEGNQTYLDDENGELFDTVAQPETAQKKSIGVPFEPEDVYIGLDSKGDEVFQDVDGKQYKIDAYTDKPVYLEEPITGAEKPQAKEATYGQDSKGNTIQKKQEEVNPETIDRLEAERKGEGSFVEENLITPEKDTDVFKSPAAAQAAMGREGLTDSEVVQEGDGWVIKTTPEQKPGLNLTEEQALEQGLVDSPNWFKDSEGLWQEKQVREGELNSDYMNGEGVKTESKTTDPKANLVTKTPDEMRDEARQFMGSKTVDQLEQAGLVNFKEEAGPAKKGEMPPQGDFNIETGVANIYGGSQAEGDNAAGVLMHEVAHSGLERALGGKLHIFVKDILKQAEAGNKVAQDLKEQIFGKGDVPKALTQKTKDPKVWKMQQELAAHYIQNSQMAGQESGLSRRMTDKLKASFRESKLGRAARAVGIDIQLTPQMAVEYAHRAAQNSLDLAKELDRLGAPRVGSPADQAIQLKEGIDKTKVKTVGDILESNVLFDNDPELKKEKVQFAYGGLDGAHTQGDTIYLSSTFKNTNIASLKPTLLRELDWVRQNKKGWQGFHEPVNAIGYPNLNAIRKLAKNISDVNAQGMQVLRETEQLVSDPERAKEAEALLSKGGDTEGKLSPQLLEFADKLPKQDMEQDPEDPSILQSNIFYSELTQKIEDSKQSKAPPQQWLNMIRKENKKGDMVYKIGKEEEFKWSGVEEWLKSKKGAVSKEELVEYLRENEVRLEDVTLGGASKFTIEDLGRLGKALKRVDYLGFDDVHGAKDAIKNNEDWVEQWDVKEEADLIELGAKYRQALQDAEAGRVNHSQYQMDGEKTDYREIALIKKSGLDRLKNEIEKELVKIYEQGYIFEPTINSVDVGSLRENGFDETADKLEQFSLARTEELESYKPPKVHKLPDNTIAHTRFNTREIDGKKTLFIEEIQSDWHQTGKKEGYKDGKPIESIQPYLKERYLTLPKNELDWTGRVLEEAGVSPQEIELWSDELANKLLNIKAVPDAPFKPTPAWTTLAFKRMLRHAVDNGFEQIAWTPGEVQGERYPSDDPSEDSKRMEGMKEFYDKILPNSVNKFAKKFGGRVGTKGIEKPDSRLENEKTNIKYLQDEYSDVFDSEGLVKDYIERKDLIEFLQASGIEGSETLITQLTNKERNLPETIEHINHYLTSRINSKKIQKVWTLDITPQMKEVVPKGMTLFSNQNDVRGDLSNLADNLYTGRGDLTSEAPQTLDSSIFESWDDFRKSMYTSASDPREQYDLGMFQRMYVKFVDSFSTIENKDVGIKDIYDLSESKRGNKIDEINRRFVEPLVKLVKESGVKLKEINDWIAARHIWLDGQNLAMSKAASYDFVNRLLPRLTEEKRKEVILERDEILKKDKSESKEAQQAMYNLMEKAKVDERIKEGETGISGEWQLFKQHASGMFVKGEGLENTANAPDAEEIYNRHLNNSKLEEVSKVFDQLTQHQLALLEEGGNITQRELVALMKDKPHYSPLRRDAFDYEKTFDFLNQKGFGPSKGVSVRYGSANASKPVHAIQNALAKAHGAAATAQKNLANNYLYEQIIENRDNWKGWFKTDTDATQAASDKLGFVKKKKTSNLDETTIRLIRKGKRLLIIPAERNTRAEVFSAAVNKLGAQEYGAVSKVFGWVNSIVRFTAVSASPPFLAVNVVRDPLTAMYNMQASEAKEHTGEIMGSIGNTYKALYDVYWKGNRDPENPNVQMVERFENAGARITFIESLKEMDTSMKSFDTKVKIEGTPVVKQLAGLANGIEKANIIVENVMRLATFDKMYKVFYDQKVDEVGHKEADRLAGVKAARIAKDLTTNFTRKGFSSASIGMFYVFFNATVQGNVQVIKNMMKSKKLMGMMAGTVAMAFVFDQIGRAVGEEDEDGENDWDKRLLHERERNIFLPFKINGAWAKIPAPWVYNVIWRLGGMLGENTAGVRSGADTGMDTISMLLNTFNPLGGGTFGQFIAPTALDPVMQVVENKNFAGNPLRPINFPGASSKPDAELAWRNTPEIYKDVSRTLNEATGGDIAHSGWMDISPSTFQNTVNFFGAGLLKFMVDSGTTIGQVLGEDEVTLKNIPIISQYASVPSEQMETQKYYDRTAEVTSAEKAIRDYGRGETKDLEKQREAKIKYREVLKMSKQVKDSKKQLRSLRVRLNAARARGDKGTEEKMEERIASVRRRFNRTWSKRIED